jgi:DNA-binding CsgD family transcriptional regulator/tetratricopeptide (TPR) repeat protein
MGGRVSSPTVVGRTEELRVLEAAAARAANRDPTVVLVGGEAGVGKTRLIAELASRCGADGMRVLSGGCVPVVEGGLPYAPMVEALRVLLADLGAHGVRQLVGPSWPELARLLPSLGETETTGPPGQTAQARLFELLLGLLGRLGEQTPLVLVLEDLHWADRSTRDLLAFLVRNLRRERVLLVGSYRSDEPRPQRLGPWLAELDRGGPVERIELPRLNRAETAAQLVAILGAAPPNDLVDAVFSRSEGNPFFTEELLEAVRAGSLELPTTARDLLRGRVELLGEPTQQVLRVAAVAGRRVPHRLLAAVAGLNDQELVGALRGAVASQMLVIRPGQDGYQFRHVLLQETVYGGLLPGERTRLHATYAGALAERPELLDRSPAAAELATHWDAAGEPVRALPARVQAGLAADRARGFPEAHDQYERALELWDQVFDPGRAAGLDRVELLTRAADAAGFAGRVERALVLLTAALDQLQQTGDWARAALLHMRVGAQRWAAGDEPACLAALEEAVRILPPDPSAERARVLAAHAQWLMLAGRGRDAARRAEEALAVARTVGARAEEGHALDILGSCTGDIEHLEEARRIAEEVGNAEGVTRADLDLSAVLWSRGRLREAHDVGLRGLAVARELGLERSMGSFLAESVAGDLVDLGEWEESDRVIADALEHQTAAAFRLQTIKGLLEVGRGDFSAAREHLELAMRLSTSPFEGAWPHCGLAKLAMFEGRYDDARAAIDEAVGILEQLDSEQRLLSPDAAVVIIIGLWVEADCAELARAERSAAGVVEARRRAGSLVAALQGMTGPSERVADVEDGWLPCCAAVAEAELSRLEGRPDPELWARAARRWERLEVPYFAACARFREAEALLAARAPRARIEPVIRAAHRTTVRLGARPLQREIELLAKRGRLRLGEPTEAASGAEPEAPSPAASLGLTRREVEVLALLADGRTNRQIGQELFIAEGTAGVHVSRILTKLGVSGRGEAAAIAHRLGLQVHAAK